MGSEWVREEAVRQGRGEEKNFLEHQIGAEQTQWVARARFGVWAQWVTRVVFGVWAQWMLRVQWVKQAQLGAWAQLS